MQATVQKNCPMVEIARMKLAQLTVSAWLKMSCTAPPPVVTPFSSCTANRKASSRIQPPMPE